MIIDILWDIKLMEKGHSADQSILSVVRKSGLNTVFLKGGQATIVFMEYLRRPFYQTGFL